MTRSACERVHNISALPQNGSPAHAVTVAFSHHPDDTDAHAGAVCTAHPRRRSRASAGSGRTRAAARRPLGGAGRATAAAAIDTHMHADYLSGARAAAARWQVPYFVHPEDARSPYDGAEGRFAHQPLTEGDTIAFGRATLVAAHVPGHTLGSTALVLGDALALTGDFLFVRSVGRPDLGGQRHAWTAQLWDSLERVRREWPGDLLVLPAHYASEGERRADRSVAARFDVIAATNEAVMLPDRTAFLTWVTDRSTQPPDSYRTIKLANLGLVDVSDADAEILEVGPNLCAVK